MITQPCRLAVIVSHPIQYYVPLYQRLARRKELEVRVFYTWHAADTAMLDPGFETLVAWDIPLKEGYEFERVPNVSRTSGTHRFFGLQNPSLFAQVSSWRPDVVHLTGWAWASHLSILRDLHRRGVPVLFRGDSHLLDSHRFGPRWWAKRMLLRRVFSWPSEFLYVGLANRAYFKAFGVQESRLRHCPHSIDVPRFADNAEAYEHDAAELRLELGVAPSARVLLFAGKFERKKRPLELMHALLAHPEGDLKLLLVGGGELQEDVRELAGANPQRFRVLPFQNQSRMPAIYRLGDLFVLPSAFGESWGLAVNEALACGRPVLVSDRVGCAADAVDESCGAIFRSGDQGAMIAAAHALTSNPARVRELRLGASKMARRFDISVSEAATVAAVLAVKAAG